MTEYEIFLSSPSDVKVERDRAEQVILKLNSERTGTPQFRLRRWEDDYYSAAADFQAQIVRPADCQVVICIFWQRLGSELPPKYMRPDGTVPTGTEYEFYDALEAASTRPEKLPDILVYRKTANVQLPSQLDEPDKYALEAAQYARFGEFWRRWFRSEKGQFLAAFEHFSDTDEFAKKLEKNLRAWLRERKSGVTWDNGSPYRGLEPFDVEHAPIFFGRRREIERARARLIAATIAAKSFLLISGGSGCGKSSLARAGLIPRLRQVGGLSTIAGALRWAIVDPGQIAADWAGGVARSLLTEEALGEELKKGDFATEQALRDQLSAAASSSVLPVANALSRARDAVSPGSEDGRVALLLLVDQLEQIFLWPKRNAEAFLRTLKLFTEHSEARVLLVATMRSDFLHRLAEFDVLVALAGNAELKAPEEPERILELALPSSADLDEMIAKPAEAAGLHFEISDDGERDLLQLIEAEARPEAMPAIQLLLSHLYNRKNDRLLTLKAYDDLHGVTGVMAQLGEEALDRAGEPGRAAFPRVVRALVSQMSAGGPATVRRANESKFRTDPPALKLIEQLKEARLVVSDRGELRFAHDSALTGWTRLKEQISKERRLYEARELVERLCENWTDPATGKRQSARLLEGFPLAEARELLAEWGEQSLTDKQSNLPDFIKASVRRATLRSAVGYAAVALVGAGLVLSAALYRSWRGAENEAAVASAISRSRADLRDNNAASAARFAKTAVQIIPSEQSRSALIAALLDVSPNLLATFDIGADIRPAIAWLDETQLAFIPNSARAVRTIDIKPHAAQQGAAFLVPEIKRDSDGNLAGIEVLHAVSPDLLMAVFNEGTLGLLVSGKQALLHKAQSGTLLGASSASSGVGATLIATVSVSGETVASDCVHKSAGELSCADHAVIGIEGKVVAVSPDETRFAVADRSGSITFYDRQARSIGQPMSAGANPSALAWSPKDRLAVATLDGSVAILKPGSTDSEVRQPITGSIPSLAWSRDGKNLVFPCGNAVCLWLSTTNGAGELEFGPIRRLEGHSAAVTRAVWSPSGTKIASQSSDGVVKIWTVDQNREVQFALFAERNTKISSVATSADAKWIAAGGDDGTIRIWDAASTGLERVEKLEDASPVVSLAWSKSSDLAACHDDGSITVVPWDRSKAARRIDRDARCMRRLAYFDRDRSVALPQRGPNQIEIIDPEDKKPPVSIELGEDEPWGIATDQAGALLFTNLGQGVPGIIDPATKSITKMSPTLLPGGGRGESLAISADGKWIATSGSDRHVRIYDIEKKAGYQVLAMEQDEPNVVSFSPNDAMLAALGTKNRLYIWANPSFDPVAVIDIVLSRTLVAVDNQRTDYAGGMAWLNGDSIILATGASTVRIIRINPVAWLARAEAIASIRVQP
ncbi:WD40 repeat domain-containing protein [Bradyrhizobium canariense]|nr:hypothetical protein [Bradyrhizobium canariense]OSI68575.1 hypothetical protein BSZ22_20620 [Bradyrhizobium canariense]OSI78023.1 hypothetical protein BSZ23_19620 [Bradyrhizobium canariense]